MVRRLSCLASYWARTMVEVNHYDWESERLHWYNQTYVLLEIAKCLREKELCFIEKEKFESRKSKVMRCGQGYNIDLIKNHMKAFRFMQFPTYNMYFSLMDFKMMPVFSFAPPIRREQYKEWSSGQYKQHFKSYDFAIDIDAKTLQEAQKCALKVKSLFDQYELPYTTKFSGSKGFHLRIEAEWLPPLPIGKVVPMLSELTHRMKIIDKLPDIDDSIIDDRRVFKLPYSFDRGNICLPLDDAHLENFQEFMVKPNYVLNRFKIKNRGLLTRNTNQTVHKANERFIEFAENFIDVEKWIK